jgi:hypothetical protein
MSGPDSHHQLSGHSFDRRLTGPSSPDIKGPDSARSILPERSTKAPAQIMTPRFRASHDNQEVEKFARLCGAGKLLNATLSHMRTFQRENDPLRPGLIVSIAVHNPVIKMAAMIVRFDGFDSEKENGWMMAVCDNAEPSLMPEILDKFNTIKLSLMRPGDRSESLPLQQFNN